MKKLFPLLSALSLLPLLVWAADPLRDTSGVLDNDSFLGSFLHALTGDEAVPSRIQVVSHTTTLILILAGMRLFRIRPPSPATDRKEIQ